MSKRRQQTISALLVAVAISLTGCGASDKPPTEASSPSSAPSSAPSSPARFTSQTFAIPFTATVPASFKATPTENTATLVSWSSVDGERYIRVLIPAVLYQPGSTTPKPPPADYLTYLRGLTSAGASFTDEFSVTIGGQSVTLMTANASEPLDGTLGCPTPETPPDVCFGLQPELTLRIAVVTIGKRTLLAWARVDRNDTEAAKYFADFETMLQQVQFA